MKKSTVVFAAILSVACAHAANVASVQVKALDGFGGDTSAVLTRCQTQEGAAYDPVTVSRDVTALNDSGEFQEISVDAQDGEDGVAVVFYVKRKLRYQAPLVVKGNDFFSESKIAKEAGLKDGHLYSEGELAAAERRGTDPPLPGAHAAVGTGSAAAG